MKKKKNLIGNKHMRMYITKNWLAIGTTQRDPVRRVHDIT